jgi:hypothetical protein
MPNFKQILLILFAGAIGGVLAVIFVAPILVRTNFLNTAIVLDKIIKPQTVTQVQKETVVVSSSDYFSEAIKKVGPNVVAIQSFSGGQLVRSGSGIVLTQDGLLATTNSVVPENADVFQVFSGGKVYKAKVVFRDYDKNIAIISVPDASFQVAKFKPDPPDLGRQLLIFSKQVSFSKENPFVEEVLVSRTDEENSTFFISAAYNYQLFGSALTDGEGTVLGMVDFRNQKPVVIFSKLIEEALNNYLARSR